MRNLADAVGEPICLSEELGGVTVGRRSGAVHGPAYAALAMAERCAAVRGDWYGL